MPGNNRKLIATGHPDAGASPRPLPGSSTRRRRSRSRPRAAAAYTQLRRLDCRSAHDALGGATELAIRDGAGGAVLWRHKLQTAATRRT